MKMKQPAPPVAPARVAQASSRQADPAHAINLAIRQGIAIGRGVARALGAAHAAPRGAGKIAASYAAQPARPITPAPPRKATQVDDAARERRRAARERDLERLHKEDGIKLDIVEELADVVDLTEVQYAAHLVRIRKNYRRRFF